MKSKTTSDQVLLLGDPRLHEKSREIRQEELPLVQSTYLNEALFEV